MGRIVHRDGGESNAAWGRGDRIKRERQYGRSQVPRHQTAATCAASPPFLSVPRGSYASVRVLRPLAAVALASTAVWSLSLPTSPHRRLATAPPPTHLKEVANVPPGRQQT